MFNSKAHANLIFSALCAASLLSFPLIPEAKADELITRSERCDRLRQQLQTALSGHVETGQARQASALQKKGNKFCASKRQAQGLRTYAKALKLLGLKPDIAEPGEQEGATPK